MSKYEVQYLEDIPIQDSKSVEDGPGNLQQGVHRGLHARHVQMIAMGGTIGTGLFLASGGNIFTAGPLGALIAYVAIGFMVFCVMTCLGEMTTFLPVSGSFNHYAARFVDPAFGFALGWNYWFSWSCAIATELSAASLIIGYWNSSVLPSWAWCLVFLVFLFLLNIVGVRVYGEAEYWFAIIKVITVIVFIIIAILVDAGAVGSQGPIGFRYYSDPGPFVGGFQGTVSVLLSAGFAFQGTELVGITAGESKNPRKTVPRAIRNVFWRILLFYVIAIFLEGLVLPSNDPLLLNTASDVRTAPFTLVFSKAGISVGASLVNAVILTSVLSAGNSAMYASSRVMMALAREGKAPSFLGYTNKQGVPILSLCFSCVIACVCLVAALVGDGQAFSWLMDITGVAGFISWMGIGASHFRFRKAYVAQGRRLEDLPYRAVWYPFSPLFAVGLCVLIILVQGYVNFTDGFNAVGFVASYIGIVPFVFAYVGYKLIVRPKVVGPLEADFDTGRIIRYEEEDEVDPNADKWWMKLYNIIA
ncbi:amino acid permease/ SLC12A domain-containing protein [Jimgerdemannia flammicorona]|uniref:Amino acid permease/ SLC12A domain-containing protein n=1 Tax=Jimgerdemannia flammicorona TaxID=994334 RepID=A0A433QDQ9_9FUNG|nr:amino acid permease/ SLC12A domain-containing protein [Jimgerdemannia flammicorona]